MSIHICILQQLRGHELEKKGHEWYVGKFRGEKRKGERI